MIAVVSLKSELSDHYTAFSVTEVTCTLCLKKNDNDVLRYNFNAHQPILIIFGRDIAE